MMAEDEADTNNLREGGETVMSEFDVTPLTVQRWWSNAMEDQSAEEWLGIRDEFFLHSFSLTQ